MKKIIEGPKKRQQLQALLEGYLYGLGEVCHQLFGSKGEQAMYSAIGSYFLSYLKRHMGIEFIEQDPWERYCHIVEVFTSYGFYSHVEMEQRGSDEYWMLETDQYAANVWEEQASWERGIPPCPLWSIIMHSLSEINYKIVLDSFSYHEQCNGYESTFHFEKTEATDEDVLALAKKTLRSTLIPICANCKKIRDENDNWVSNDEYFTKNYDAKFSHSICPTCFEKLYPRT
jgi:hypothetical protein